MDFSSAFSLFCKREEEMKIREKALQDNNERTVRLESYIKNLELEKTEYENTIRTLKQKIVNLEDVISSLLLIGTLSIYGHLLFFI
jgi:chromosome segregation ATPase